MCHFQRQHNVKDAGPLLREPTPDALMDFRDMPFPDAGFRLVAFADGDITEPLTLYDLKGKSATDMWLSKVPLEQIQQRCGHDSVTTT